MNTYNAVAAGADFGGVKNPNPGRLRGSLQETTFGLSIVAQIVTLVLGIIALAQGGLPEVLMTVLVLEVVVQAVEIVWYGTVGGLYFFGKYSISVAARYFDWAITTPLMLVSILLFSVWDADKDCVTSANVLSDGSRVATVVVVVLLDWLMLAIGVSYEAKIERVTSVLNRAFCGMNGLWLGFIPFVGAFIPLFVIGGQGASRSGWSLASVLITFVSWIFYGIVALYISDAEMRNTSYNLLDIVSKNAVGIIVSSVALGNEFNLTATCVT